MSERKYFHFDLLTRRGHGVGPSTRSSLCYIVVHARTRAHTHTQQIEISGRSSSILTINQCHRGRRRPACMYNVVAAHVRSLGKL